MSSSDQDKKKKTRAQRNLAAANASRARKKLFHAQLVEEKSYLTESNAIMRQQLDLLPTVGGLYGGGTPGAGSSSSARARGSQSDMVVLSDSLSQLLGGRKGVQSAAIVDLLDRALTGSKGKGPPVDPEICAHWASAQTAAPKNPKTALRSAVDANGCPIVVPQRSAVAKPSTGNRGRGSRKRTGGGGGGARDGGGGGGTRAGGSASRKK